MKAARKLKEESDGKEEKPATPEPVAATPEPATENADG
jgi:hypothetical protein